MSPADYFRFPYTMGLHDSDAAALMFSANLIRICHQGHEAMMDSLGFSIGRLLRERPFGLPVVHIEGDFRHPLRVGETVEIRIRVAHIGRSSFRMAYELVKQDETVVATAATVYACVDPKTHQKRDLPDELKKKLELYTLEK